MVPSGFSGTSPPGLVAFHRQRPVRRGVDPPRLSPKERSLVTVAALTTSGNTDQSVFHLDYARRNGNTETELIEAITHLAVYAGWPKAVAAMAVAKRVFRGDTN